MNYLATIPQDISEFIDILLGTMAFVSFMLSTTEGEDEGKWLARSFFVVIVLLLKAICIG